jgi:hypothetical protein
MKRPAIFIYSLIIAIVLACVAHAHAQTIPQRVRVARSVGAAGVAITCGPAAPSAAQQPLVNHLTGYTVMCGIASGATAEAAVTVTGLSGGTTTLGYIDESTTAPTFLAEDLTYPAIAVDGTTAIIISMPAVTNGGPCTCVAFYAQY